MGLSPRIDLLPLAASCALALACGRGPEAPASEAAARYAVPAAREAWPADARLDRALEALGRGDEDEARALALAVLDEQPGHGRAELLLGLSFHRETRYALALPHLERAASGARSYEGDRAAWYYLGWCDYWLGRLDEAHAAFSAHLERDPAEGDAVLGLGLIALERGERVEAEAHLRRAIELFELGVAGGKSSLAPDLARAHARLADVLVEGGRSAEAKDELVACVRVWPAHFGAWYKLYRVHLELGEDEAASAALAQYERWKERAESAGAAGE